MSSFFVHNGHRFKTEAEYYASVVKNGETRNAVSLAAARYYYNRCLELYKLLGERKLGSDAPKPVEEVELQIDLKTIEQPPAA